MSANSYDAIIIGARAAGAATAMLMARNGLRVLVAERGAPGTDTLSSHNITRGAVIQLDRWGLTGRIMAAGTPPITRSTFYFGSNALPFDIKPVGSASGILGTRRFVLDRILVEAATDAGAEVRFHTSFRDVIRNKNGHVIGATLTDAVGNDLDVHAPLVVGADGMRSTVARRVGARTRKQSSHALAHIYGYYGNMPLTENHAFFVRGASIATAPTNGETHVVIASLPEDRLRRMRTDMDDKTVLEALAEECNAGFGTLLKNARPTEAFRVFRGAHGFVRDCAGPGWALVGDAGYFRDPVTAHGMTDAFRDAELLARAAGHGDAALAGYQARRDEITAEIWEITDRIAAYDNEPHELQAMFHELAMAMRTEQAWMAEQFDHPALAA